MDEDTECLFITSNAAPWNGGALASFTAANASDTAETIARSAEAPSNPTSPDPSPHPSYEQQQQHQQEPPALQLEGAPPQLKRRLQPDRCKNALDDVLDAHKQRRLLMVEGGGGADFRHVSQRQKASDNYAGLAPSSKSSKHLLALADAQLYRKKAPKLKQRTSFEEQEGSASPSRGAPASLSPHALGYSSDDNDGAEQVIKAKKRKKDKKTKKSRKHSKRNSKSPASPQQGAASSSPRSPSAQQPQGGSALPSPRLSESSERHDSQPREQHTEGIPQGVAMHAHAVRRDSSVVQLHVPEVLPPTTPQKGQHAESGQDTMIELLTPLDGASSPAPCGGMSHIQLTTSEAAAHGEQSPPLKKNEHQGQTKKGFSKAPPALPAFRRTNSKVTLKAQEGEGSSDRASLGRSRSKKSTTLAAANSDTSVVSGESKKRNGKSPARRVSCSKTISIVWAKQPQKPLETPPQLRARPIQWKKAPSGQRLPADEGSAPVVESTQRTRKRKLNWSTKPVKPMHRVPKSQNTRERLPALLGPGSHGNSLFCVSTAAASTDTAAAAANAGGGGGPRGSTHRVSRPPEYASSASHEAGVDTRGRLPSLTTSKADQSRSSDVERQEQQQQQDETAAVQNNNGPLSHTLEAILERHRLATGGASARGSTYTSNNASNHDNRSALNNLSNNGSSPYPSYVGGGVRSHYPSSSVSASSPGANEEPYVQPGLRAADAPYEDNTMAAHQSRSPHLPAASPAGAASTRGRRLRSSAAPPAPPPSQPHKTELQHLVPLVAVDPAVRTFSSTAHATLHGVPDLFGHTSRSRTQSRLEATRSSRALSKSDETAAVEESKKGQNLRKTSEVAEEGNSAEVLSSAYPSVAPRAPRVQYLTPEVQSSAPEGNVRENGAAPSSSAAKIPQPPPTRRPPVPRSNIKKKPKATAKDTAYVTYAFAPYMPGMRSAPDGRARYMPTVAHKNTLYTGRPSKKRDNNKNGASRKNKKTTMKHAQEAAPKPQPIDYTALATQHDPLDYLLGRHGFWGESTTR